MEFTLSTETFRQLPEYVIVILAFVGYTVGAILYSLVKGHFAGKLLTTQVQVFGNVSRVTHLLSYMFLGYVFPNRFVTVMLLGVGWEVIEYAFGTIMSDKYWGEGQDYVNDVFANAIGFLVGYALYRSSSTEPDDIEA